MSGDASHLNSAQPPTCHGAQIGRSDKRRHGLLIAAGLAIVAIALGVVVDRQWLSLGALTPLLLTLPCAVMMLLCMRGMNRNAGADADAQSSDTPVSR